MNKKSTISDRCPHTAAFWEVWLLVLVLVTIFGLFVKTEDIGSNNNAQIQNRLDPYDLHREELRGDLESNLETGF